MSNLEKKVLYAGGVGFLAVLGFIAVRKWLKKESEDLYYGDFQRIFLNSDQNQENNDGVEYFSVL